MLKTLEKHNWVSWSVTFLIALAIFILSSIKFDYSKMDVSLWSLVYHFFAFFFLAFFLAVSCIKGSYKKKRLFLFTVMTSVVYAILDELHQYFVPGRYMSLLDMGVDSLGILVASAIYFVRVRRK